MPAPPDAPAPEDSSPSESSAPAAPAPGAGEPVAEPPSQSASAPAPPSAPPEIAAPNAEPQPEPAEAPTAEGVPAGAVATEAAAAGAVREPPPAQVAERRPSFLDPHPTGNLPSIYEHDVRKHQGFSVRLSAGLGYGATSRRLSRDTYKVRGLAGLLSLDIGASVIENLIVYGRVSGFAWNSLLASDAANAGGSYLALIGAGARYYLMPYNIFGSATVGLAATQVLDDLGNAQNAHPGIGFELEVGHDFWAGTPLDQRAVGLSLRFGYVTAGAAGTRQKDPKAWNSFAISLLFCAAYN